MDLMRQCLSERKAAILIVAPLGFLVPAAFLTFIAIITPWWRSERVVLVPTAIPGIDETIRQISEISLWSHIGCRLNETWEDICGLPEAACIEPRRPPEGYKLPWTPPPDDIVIPTTRFPAVDPGSSVSTFPPATTAPPAFLCVAGIGCKTPPPTTTINPKKLLPPVREPGGGQLLGDGQARNPVEATSSNEDGARIPPTDPPPIPPTDPPRLPPEVVAGALLIMQTTAIPTEKPAKSILSAFGEATIRYETVLTQKDPRAAPRPTGPPSSPAYVGVQNAVLDCPPEGEHPAFFDEYAPPAGFFLCELKQSCGKILPVRFMLFAAEGLAVLEIMLLLLFGFIKNPKAHFIIEGVDIVIPFLSVLLLFGVLVALLAAVISADAAGLSDTKKIKAAVHRLEGAGATCAIISLVCAAAGFLMGSVGVLIRVCINVIAASDAALAAEAAEYAQTQLEITEEWKLEQEEIQATKRPQPIGWRTVRIAPEPELKFALQDGFVQPGAEATRATSKVSSKVASKLTLAGSSSASGTPWTSAVGSLAATPRGLQAMVLALDGAAPKPEEQLQLSLPVRAANEEAPSKAAEACMRNFLESGEGAVYAQHIGSSTTPASTARRQEEWVAKTSRQNGMTYYVNADTGETRWTPPSSAREAWSSGGEQAAGQASHEKSPEELWKKKRLKSGVVVSVKAK